MAYYVHNKRPSPERRKGIDRISSLSDDLLSHILSFLSIEAAFRTCILSNRWKMVFASNPVPDLLFDDASTPLTIGRRVRDHVHRKNFGDFVDKVLRLRINSGVGIRRFRLRCSDLNDGERVCNWISAALRLNVEELCLQLYYSKLALPCGVFYSKMLVVLKLSVLPHKLEFPTLVCLPSLKVLHLSYMSFCEDGFLRLISGCHVLEEFAMSNCSIKTENGVLTILIPTLRRLRLELLHDAKVVFETPCLDHLGIRLVSQGFTWRNLKPLAMDHIEISARDLSTHLQQNDSIFSSISQLNHLCLTANSLQDLKVESSRLPFKVTHLELLYSPSDMRILNWLGYFAEIKVLTLTWGYHGSTIARFPNYCPRCLSELLEVNIGSFRGEESEVCVLEYFLRNARALKKMTIKSCISSSEDRLRTTSIISSLRKLALACLITIT